ncbi:MAG: alpha/beta hydrolase-fold protein [Chloroflexota bacterium]
MTAAPLRHLRPQGTIGLAVLALTLNACTNTNASNSPATALPREPSATAPVPSTAPSATSTPRPTPAGCNEARGRTERTQLPTSLQPHPLQVRVYYPPCYDPQPEVPYPVLVMIHGQTYTDDQWDRLGLDEAANDLILAGQSRPFLIFMPLEEDTERDPENSNFDRVVAEALLPWIDANFPSCRERACRAVGGLSRGATWAVHLGFLRPELFGSIGAHSLTPFYGDVNRLPFWLMRVQLEDLPRFYLDMGQDDRFMEALTQFRQAMTEHNVPYEWHLNPGSHEEAYWSSHVMDYVRWYAAGWPPSP